MDLMDPTEFPSDEQIAAWSREYGSTGVKTYVLQEGPNRGTVAVYREMSMAERGVLARLRRIEDEHPGAYDTERMIVSGCLLHPTLEAYPHPAFAAGELFSRIRQHGHGPLMEEGPTEDGLPPHMARDIREARRAAEKTFSDGRFTSEYKHLIFELVMEEGGRVDPVALDRLWHMSPGRIRDIAAQLEQATAMVARRIQQAISEAKNKEHREHLKQRLQQFSSPYAPFDEATGGATVPGGEEEETDASDAQPAAEEPPSGHLPPNRPPSPSEMKSAIEGARHE